MSVSGRFFCWCWGLFAAALALGLSVLLATCMDGWRAMANPPTGGLSRENTAESLVLSNGGVPARVLMQDFVWAENIAVSSDGSTAIITDALTGDVWRVTAQPKPAGAAGGDAPTAYLRDLWITRAFSATGGLAFVPVKSLDGGAPDLFVYGTGRLPDAPHLSVIWRKRFDAVEPSAGPGTVEVVCRMPSVGDLANGLAWHRASNRLYTATEGEHFVVGSGGVWEIDLNAAKPVVRRLNVSADSAESLEVLTADGVWIDDSSDANSSEPLDWLYASRLFPGDMFALRLNNRTGSGPEDRRAVFPALQRSVMIDDFTVTADGDWFVATAWAFGQIDVFATPKRLRRIERAAKAMLVRSMVPDDSRAAAAERGSIPFGRAHTIVTDLRCPTSVRWGTGPDGSAFPKSSLFITEGGFCPFCACDSRFRLLEIPHATHILTEVDGIQHSAPILNAVLFALFQGWVWRWLLLPLFAVCLIGGLYSGCLWNECLSCCRRRATAEDVANLHRD